MKRFLRKKILVAVLSITLALIMTFFVAPKINEAKNETKKIMVFNGNYSTASKIEESMISISERGVFGLSDYIEEKEKNEIIGQYLTMDVLKDEYISKNKISSNSNDSKYLEDLPENKQAISFTIKSFAKGLSAKILQNDIIRILSVTQSIPEDTNYTQSAFEGEIKEELNYLKVLAVTYPNARDLKADDERTKETKESELPITITVLADNLQAKSIAALEEKGSIHVSLVYRGNEYEQLLKLQDEINLSKMPQNQTLENSVHEDATSTKPKQEEKVKDQNAN